MRFKSHNIALGGLTLLGLMFSQVALAHTGDLAAGLLTGLLHPLTGIDHLLMIILIAIYTAQTSFRQRFSLPCVLLITLATGALLGANAFSVDAVETGIAISLLGLGLLLMLPRATTSIWAMVIFTLAGLMHGLAHGLEIPGGIAGLTFIPGFLITSAALLITCIWLGLYIHPGKNRFITQTYGGAIATIGLMALIV